MYNSCSSHLQYIGPFYKRCRISVSKYLMYYSHCVINPVQSPNFDSLLAELLALPVEAVIYTYVHIYTCSEFNQKDTFYSMHLTLSFLCIDLRAHKLWTISLIHGPFNRQTENFLRVWMLIVYLTKLTSLLTFGSLRLIFPYTFSCLKT